MDEGVLVGELVELVDARLELVELGAEALDLADQHLGFRQADHPVVVRHSARHANPPTPRNSGYL
jgi:hypothetical protein